MATRERLPAPAPQHALPPRTPLPLSIVSHVCEDVLACASRGQVTTPLYAPAELEDFRVGPVEVRQDAPHAHCYEPLDAGGSPPKACQGPLSPSLAREL